MSQTDPTTLPEPRELADVPAVEVIATLAVHLMTAAAVQLGLGEPDEDGVQPPKDLDEARKLIVALAGLITAAAVILAVVMVRVGMSRVTNTKMLGLGIALAVLMDAMVIRTLLVPAVMRLTGRATWWAPPVLRRFHDRFGISEGGGPQLPAGAEKGAAPHSGETRDPEPASSS